VVTHLLAEGTVLPRKEFYIGGEIVERLSESDRKKLANGGEGATLDPDPRGLLRTVAAKVFGPSVTGEE
jgi:hypothetical protein